MRPGGTQSTSVNARLRTTAATHGAARCVRQRHSAGAGGARRECACRGGGVSGSHLRTLPVAQTVSDGDAVWPCLLLVVRRRMDSNAAAMSTLSGTSKASGPSAAAQHALRFSNAMCVLFVCLHTRICMSTLTRSSSSAGTPNVTDTRRSTGAPEASSSASAALVFPLLSASGALTAGVSGAAGSAA